MNTSKYNNENIKQTALDTLADSSISDERKEIEIALMFDIVLDRVAIHESRRDELFEQLLNAKEELTSLRGAS